MPPTACSKGLLCLQVSNRGAIPQLRIGQRAVEDWKGSAGADFEGEASTYGYCRSRRRGVL